MLKTIVYIVFFVVLATIIGGYYVKETSPAEGEKIIGIGVLLFAFLLMPLFIYLRYKDKDLSKFRLNQNQKEEDNS